MAVIFGFSSQAAEQSSATSSGVIEKIVKVIYKDFDSWSEEEKAEKIEAFQYPIRKLAHMTEYASLGILSCAFALTFGFKVKNMIFAFAFCVFYCIADEIHQAFVPDRACQFRDMLIDSTGSLLGIFGFAVLTAIILKIMKARKKGEKKDGLRNQSAEV